MYTIQREKLVPLWPELMPLLERHKAEVAPFADWVLAPDYPSYAHAEDSGRLWMWTARLDNFNDAQFDKLIGYLIMFVGPSMHYTATIIASQDVLFIAPEHRKGGLGVRLLRDSEADLRAAGVHCIAQRSKMQPGLDIGALFKRQGYRPVDEVWLKRIDQPETLRDMARRVPAELVAPGNDGPGSIPGGDRSVMPGLDRPAETLVRLEHGELALRNRATNARPVPRRADDPEFKKHCDTGGMLPLLPTIEAQQAALAVRQDAPDHHPNQAGD